MDALMPYLVGPAGAVVALAMVLYGLYRIFDTRVWPSVESWVARHLDQIDRIVNQHAEDMRALRNAIDKLTNRIDRLSGDIDDIKAAK